MIIGIGVDVVEITRIKKLYSKFDNRFIRKIFTVQEIKYCESFNIENRIAKYAKRFAAKEAVVKALGIGFTKGISFHDIEILNNSLGKPYFTISGRALEYLHSLIISGCTAKKHLSISDTKELAQAFVVIESIKNAS